MWTITNHLKPIWAFLQVFLVKTPHFRLFAVKNALFAYNSPVFCGQLNKVKTRTITIISELIATFPSLLSRKLWVLQSHQKSHFLSNLDENYHYFSNNLPMYPDTNFKKGSMYDFNFFNIFGILHHKIIPC